MKKQFDKEIKKAQKEKKSGLIEPTTGKPIKYPKQPFDKDIKKAQTPEGLKYPVTNKPIYKPYSNTWMILCIVFLIIPLFNIIFGAIGLSKYPAKDKRCKSKRAWAVAALTIGIIEFVASILAAGRTMKR